MLNLCQNAPADDPTIVFLWRDLGAFLAAISLATSPAPFPMPVPLASDGFKQSLMDHVRVLGAAAPVYRGIFPCTEGQSCLLAGNINSRYFDPWFREIALLIPPGVLPLATIVLVMSRSNTLSPVVRTLQGDPIFMDELVTSKD